jgi:hypothetical protein
VPLCSDQRDALPGSREPRFRGYHRHVVVPRADPIGLDRSEGRVLRAVVRDVLQMQPVNGGRSLTPWRQVKI